jgi:hypothetical protein
MPTYALFGAAFMPRSPRLILTWFALAAFALTALFDSSEARADEKPPRVAVITTVWRQNSHCDVIAGRLLQGYTLNGQGEFPRLKLASLYTDQIPTGDKSRDLAKEFGFPIYGTVEQALTLGGKDLAVDGVLLICEHGDYPANESGNTAYPKRRLFGEIVKVFEKCGRVVPVFSDKHLADNWQDIDWISSTARKMHIPLMAGSSLPTAWRAPPTDVKRGAKVKELVGVSYGRLDAYGFHALEMAQCLVERRRGGETGVKQVRCLEGEAVWTAGKVGTYDPRLLDETLARLTHPRSPEKPLAERVKSPVAYVIDYNDGLRVTILALNGAVQEFACAWRYADGSSDSTMFAVQESHPFMHFTYFLKNAERMIATSQPPWPIERTVLTSGILDAFFLSRKAGGTPIPTPYLKIAYTSPLEWQQPPPQPEPTPKKAVSKQK